MKAEALLLRCAAVLVCFCIGMLVFAPQLSSLRLACASNDINAKGLSYKLEQKQYYYNAKKIKAPFTVYDEDNNPLVAGLDYTYTYENNKAVGKASILIKGIGDYRGTHTIYFYICYRLAAAKLSLKSSMLAYTGGAVKASPVLRYKTQRLKKNKDYTLSFSNNKKVGNSAKVYIHGKGIYKGLLTRKFKIRKSLALHGKISLLRSSLPYIGQARKPAATVRYKKVKLKAGRDYSIKYTNCTQVGNAKVTVKGKGSYGFTKTKTYKITKGGGKIVDLSEHNGTVNFAKVKFRVDAVILRSYVTYTLSSHKHKKAGDGNYRMDYNYNNYATLCETYEISYGAYWYMVVKGKTLAKAKADTKIQVTKFFNASFSNGHRPLYLVLDIEDSGMNALGHKVAKCAQYAIECIQELGEDAGYDDGIKVGAYIGNHCYASFGFATSTGESIIADDVDFVWIPSYGKNTGSVPDAQYYPDYDWDMWQYSSNSTLAGVEGSVDVNRIDSDGPHAHNMIWYRNP